MDDASFLFHMDDIVQHRTSGSDERPTDNGTNAGAPHGLGRRFAKAIAARVDGKIVDVSSPVVTEEAEPLFPSSPEGLEVLRHSTAHLMAQAVKRLFPEVQITIGPVIESGFYYDFKHERAFTPEDLERIEAEMQAIVKENLPVSREEVPRNDAVRFFSQMGEAYKAEIIAGIPEDEVVSLYRQGEFVDLCRGPHVPSTGRLPAFKLTSVAGAYWRGDEKNEMLQRIYGTAFATPKGTPPTSRPCLRKPSGVTIVGWAGSLICSASIPLRRAVRFFIPKGPLSIMSWFPICGGSTSAMATRKC